MLRNEFTRRTSADVPNPFTGRRVHDLDLEPIIPSPERYYAEKRERFAAAQAAREATAAETIQRADDRARIAALETEIAEHRAYFVQLVQDIAELRAVVDRLRAWVDDREYERTSDR